MLRRVTVLPVSLMRPRSKPVLVHDALGPVACFLALAYVGRKHKASVAQVRCHS
jgi:hypothetical protein